MFFSRFFVYFFREISLILHGLVSLGTVEQKLTLGEVGN